MNSQAVQEIRIQDTNTIQHLYNTIQHTGTTAFQVAKEL